MYNKYFTMKRSELKEAIKAEIKSVLTENTGQERYDALNDNDQDVAILNNMTKKYGKDVVLYWLTSGNYGSLDETISEEIQVGDIVTLGGDGDELEVIDSREMFGSDMMAYRVKFPDGNTEEYSADQLRPARMMNEVYQTNSKMSQIVSLFQDMMDDEYDGQDYRKVLNMVLKAIDDDYKAAEREGEKFSRIREEDEMSDDEMDKKASKGAKKEPIGKEAERLAQVQKFMRQMQDKGIVDKDKKILDTPKYKEEFAKFKASLKK